MSEKIILLPKFKNDDLVIVKAKPKDFDLMRILIPLEIENMNNGQTYMILDTRPPGSSKNFPDEYMYLLDNMYFVAEKFLKRIK